MNEEEIIYLDKDGYEKYLEDIESLRKELTQASRRKSEAYRNSQDGWRNNFEFDDAKKDELRIINQLSDMINKLSKIQLIEKKEEDADVVNINDIVTIRLKFNNEEEEEEVFRLTATQRRDKSSDINEITINSPLGKSIYLKEIGYSGSYNVLKDHIEFTIVNKINKDELVLKRN